MKNAFRRTFERANCLGSASLLPNGGEYLMRISYGAPPFETLALLDTGSDLTWVQCLPCINGYNETYQPFDPKNSSTFQAVPCTSIICHDLFAKNNTCMSRSAKETCDYQATYLDSSFSKGNLANETITLGGNNNALSFQNFVFGCGHKNVGVTFPDKSTGIVSLGYSRFSFMSQLYSSIGGKISHCLASSTEVSNPGKVSFGNHAVVSGDGIVSTPSILDSIFYKTILDGISIANTTLKFNYTTQPPQQGNIFLDSGTTVTFLPFDFYNQLRSTSQSEIKRETVPDPLKFFDLCYSSIDDENVPLLTVHFKDADLKLKPVESFQINF